MSRRFSLASCRVLDAPSNGESQLDACVFTGVQMPLSFSCTVLLLLMLRGQRECSQPQLLHSVD